MHKASGSELPTSHADAGDVRRIRNGRLMMLAILLLCVAPVAASYFTYFVVRPQGRTNYSELIEPPKPLSASGALPLTDLRGAPVRSEALKGQWLLVVVGGGGCDVDCERLLYMQRQLREMLGKDRDRVDKVWLVTDGAPIRPELLLGIGGDPATPTVAPATVLRVEPAILARWLAPAKGAQLGQSIYLVDPMGNWMMRSPVDPDPVKLKRDLERLLRASESWDQPGR